MRYLSIVSILLPLGEGCRYAPRLETERSTVTAKQCTAVQYLECIHHFTVPRRTEALIYGLFIATKLLPQKIFTSQNKALLVHCCLYQIVSRYYCETLVFFKELDWIYQRTQYNKQTHRLRQRWTSNCLVYFFLASGRFSICITNKKLTNKSEKCLYVEYWIWETEVLVTRKGTLMFPGVNQECNTVFAVVVFITLLQNNNMNKRSVSYSYNLNVVKNHLFFHSPRLDTLSLPLYYSDYNNYSCLLGALSSNKCSQIQQSYNWGL